MPLVFKNTLLYIALILVLDLLVNSMCGYALAKFEFRGKGAVLNLVIALMVLPMEAIMLPLYIEMFLLLQNAFLFICSDSSSVTFRMI